MLNADQTDMLSELLNIAFGRATAPIARLMGRFVVLSPPQVEVIQRGSALPWLQERFGEGSHVHVVQQSFQPTLLGEAILVMRAEKGSYAWGLFADPDEDPDELEERDAALEIANLLVGACIGRLASLLQTSVRYTPPRLTLFGRPLEELELSSGPDIGLLVIHTRFTVEETRFESCLFLVLSPDVLEWLRGTLDRLIETYTGESNAPSDAEGAPAAVGG